MEICSSSGEAQLVQKSFTRFFLPSLLSCLGLAAGGLADCIFVGNAIGPVGMTAISIGQPVYMLFNVISYSLAIGGSIHYANALSSGNVETGNRIFASILRTDLLLNLVLCALGLFFLPQVLSFLGAGAPGTEVWDTCEALVRAQLLLVPIMFFQAPFYYFINCDNDPRLAAVALVTSNTLDILFNYIFVVVMDLGVAGSVYSTGLGASAMILISLVHFWRKRGCLRFCLPKYQISAVLESFRTGFATSVQYVYQFVTVLVCNHLLMSMGGELGVAVFGIVFNVALVAASVSDAISMALQPMVSTFQGERNWRSIGCTLRIALRVAAAAGLLLTALLLAIPQWVSFFFGLHTAEELHLGSTAIRVYALCIIPSNINMVLTYYYQALGREFTSYLLFTLRSFALFLLFSLVFGRFGTGLFWWAYPCTELVSLAVMWLYNRKKGSWTYLKEDDSQVFRVFLDSRTADLGAVSQAVRPCGLRRDGSPTQRYFVAIVVGEVCGLILSRAFSTEGGYIQFTIVPHSDGTVAIHLRDNARAFNPFEVNTDAISLEDGTGLDAIGIKMVKRKAKEFFYRRYAGFNTMVVRI